MTGPFAEFAERIQAARAEFEAALAQAEQDLSRFRRENRPTPEERQQLQEAALRGDLGDDMRELAEHVDRGEDNWDAVFSGESPNVELLRGHLERTIADNQEAVTQALEDDEEFDLEALRRDAEGPR
jgi:hypothetical protein